jgi:hypothetical protein
LLLGEISSFARFGVSISSNLAFFAFPVAVDVDGFRFPVFNTKIYLNPLWLTFL